MSHIIRKTLQNLDFIHVEHDLGASLPGSKEGPVVVWEKLNQLSPAIQKADVYKIEQPNPDKSIPFTPHTKNLGFSIQTMRLLRDRVSKSLKDGRLPIVFSGDHSTAIGTMAGVKQAFPSLSMGVVWFDAHTDIHSPFTTHSGNMHGMPLSAATAQGNIQCQRNELSEEELSLWNQAQELSGQKPAVDLKNIVFVGVRDSEPEEALLVREHDCLILDVPTIQSESAPSLRNKIEHQLSSCDIIYISFDIDCLDENLVPGTGTPVKQGPNVEKILALIENLSTWDKVACFEMSEVNPALDEDRQTANIAAQIVHRFLPTN